MIRLSERAHRILDEDELKDSYLPADFDLENAIFHGEKSQYRFESLLSNQGAQSVVVTIADSNGNRGVFKHYRPRPVMSTQLTVVPGSPYGWLNSEAMILSHLNDNAIISDCTRELEEINDLAYERRGRSNIVRCLGEEMIFTDYLRMTLGENRDRPIRQGTAFVFPQIKDYINFIEDSKTGKKYIPYPKPEKTKTINISMNQWHLGRMSLPIVDGDPFKAAVPLYEFVEGASLEDVIINNRSSDESEKLSIELLRAASIISGFGVAHRDLKPGNILVTKDGQVRFLDLGIAHRFSPSDNAANLACMLEYPVDKSYIKSNFGAPVFGDKVFSPMEIYQGISTNKMDVYSIGIMMALILTGKHPYIESINNWQEYVSKSFPERSVIHRTMKKLHQRALSEGPELSSLLEKHARFSKRYENHPILNIVASMIHPQWEHRLNRMAIAASKARIKPITFPLLLEKQEIFREVMLPSKCENAVFESLKENPNIEVYGLDPMYDIRLGAAYAMDITHTLNFDAYTWNAG